jgi:hypothetical protein
MKIFRLNRLEDIHGNSGTGIVAVGVIYPNGKVAMSWRTDLATVVIADSITVIEELHGHNGRTQIEYLELSKPMQKKLEEFINGKEKDNDTHAKSNGK